MSQTISEFITEHPKYKKLWLCPHLVSNGKINNPEWMRGYDCTPQSIPEEVKDKLLHRYFREGNTHCIIWFNDEDTELK